MQRILDLAQVLALAIWMIMAFGMAQKPAPAGPSVTEKQAVHFYRLAAQRADIDREIRVRQVELMLLQERKNTNDAQMNEFIGTLCLSQDGKKYIPDFDADPPVCKVVAK